MHTLKTALYCVMYMYIIYIERGRERERERKKKENERKRDAPTYTMTNTCIYTTTGIDIREELLKFHTTYYSSSIMKLAIVGREDLDTLEAWVVEMFDSVNNNGATPGTWKDLGTYIRFVRACVCLCVLLYVCASVYMHECLCGRVGVGL